MRKSSGSCRAVAQPLGETLTIEQCTGKSRWTCNSVLEIFARNHPGGVKIRLLLSRSLVMQT